MSALVPLISVVVPTFNGQHKLKNILAALENQSFRAFELIIVVDGSTDNTCEWLAVQNLSFSFRYFFQENKGRAATRNQGVKLANAPLILFLDDDMRPAPDLLARCYELHTLVPNAIIVGQQIGDPALMTTPVQRYKLFLERKWLKELPTVFTALPQDKPFITAANCSLSKVLFEKLGGFDERLQDYEDADLAIRASSSNVKIYFAPELLAFHDDYISFRSYILRLRQYYFAGEELRRLKPELTEKFERTRRKKINRVKHLILGLFAHFLWVKVLESWNIFRFIFPQHLCYRLYDLVIHSLSVHYPYRKI